jgi:hypothetical protein
MKLRLILVYACAMNPLFAQMHNYDCSALIRNTADGSIVKTDKRPISFSASSCDVVFDWVDYNFSFCYLETDGTFALHANYLPSGLSAGTTVGIQTPHIVATLEGAEPHRKAEFECVKK